MKRINIRRHPEAPGEARPRRTRVASGREWLERALGICLFLLPPLLALIPRGVAVLAGVAGLCAAARVTLDPQRRVAVSHLRFPAAILAMLLLWGGLSAIWSIDPWRSLLIDARLAGLFTAGLALAAAGSLVAPWRLMPVALIVGTALGLVLAAGDLASGGTLSHLVSVRSFAGSRLNQLAAWLAVLALPTAGLLACRRQRLVALVVLAGGIAAVFVLYDTTAKIAVGAALPFAALCTARRRTTRVVAVLAVVGILTVPVTLPQLVQRPGLFAAVDAYKVSAGHRLLIWSFTGDRIAERPFLGWGLDAARAIPGGKDEIRPGQAWLPLHPHDAALQVWLELGAAGAALFALFVGFLWLSVGEAPWPSLYAAASGGSLTAVLVLALAGWGVWEEWWLGTLDLALFAIIAMGRVCHEPLQHEP